ncbi:RagB/SusD family nutrient uptake outer membrane protein [Dysgonomonas sp. Marseille-P4677]|uniref:RagB/SusD family nutrient uptake outer membrane protein n=1 Tax=Dysgonomonas sp. Marseille-P4677 TaxID=2364790 RepID=UPI0019117338|nr:RagB/SusD family nutrient uptake outer membrane protein [Dysgonomonas sp. Marseille-P4677]MBK5721703.1 RagB/SusD family nutrient uptake outer membrane protein [Dysgonomonas sp. Marseille-P4677]
MKKYIHYILIFTILPLIVMSCDDFLDVEPDNRTNLETEENINRMLISVYPSSHYNILTELMSDNADDRGARYDDFDDNIDFLKEVYFWKDIKENDSDGIESLWTTYYNAIASSNYIIQAIENMGEPKNMMPQKGEALIARAYNHFTLVNIFSMHYKAGSTDLGIPYMTEPTNSVNPEVDRSTVEEVYKKIEKDIEDGLLLINDELHSAKEAYKYHFNRNSAYALAVRFYLYSGNYPKVIEYANKVLEEDPASMMRNWVYQSSTSDGVIASTRFTDSSLPCNFLIASPSSSAGLFFGPYNVGVRFSFHQGIASTELPRNSLSPWYNPATGTGFPYLGIYTLSATQKSFSFKLGYYFEYTDKVNGIGYRRSVFPLFTAEEVLLSRAEAYAMTGEFDKATADLAIFSKAFINGGKIAIRSDIHSLYSEMPYYSTKAPTPKKKLNVPNIEDGSEKESFIHCILFARRILLLHEGLRWFDIKRFGIEIERRAYDEFTGVYTQQDILKKDDKRRAVQVPQEVIQGGLVPNPR